MKTDKISIVKELGNRLVQRKNDRKLIGNDLKFLRKSRNETLDEFYKDVNSISYWSRVEANQIVPKQEYLSAVFTNKDISIDKLDVIYSYESHITKAIKAFITNDLKTLSKIVEMNEGGFLKKSQIVSLIYYLTIGDMPSASDIFYSIEPTVSSLSEEDLLTFSVFSGVFHYMCGNFQLSLEIFDSLKGYKIDDDLVLICRIYEFYNYCYNMKDEAFITYEKLYYDLCSQRLDDLCEKLSYYMAIFYAKRKSKITFELIRKRLKDDININSVDVIYAFYSEGNVNKLNFKTSELSDYANCLMKCNSSKAYVRNSLEKHQGKIEIDYDFYVISYLSKNSQHRADYIYEITPIIAYLDNDWLNDFFLKVIVDLCFKTGKYKRIYSYYKLVYRS